MYQLEISEVWLKCGPARGMGSYLSYPNDHKIWERIITTFQIIKYEYLYIYNYYVDFLNIYTYIYIYAINALCILAQAISACVCVNNNDKSRIIYDDAFEDVTYKHAKHDA